MTTNLLPMQKIDTQKEYDEAIEWCKSFGVKEEVLYMENEEFHTLFDNTAELMRKYEEAHEIERPKEEYPFTSYPSEPTECPILNLRNIKETEDIMLSTKDVNDNLPEIVNLDDSFAIMPPLSPVLIDGILRKGHKMQVAGPTKAGKSFDLLELLAAISSGSMWHGFQCVKGKVLYVNLEIDEPSCIHRLKDIENVIGIDKLNPKNIDLWHLRGGGEQVIMTKLAPKLIKRAMSKNYSAIIIDPIYKVITGDENNAQQMGKFFNLFDTICRDLGTSIIYCHHHSKGEQGQKKSMDRSSGSGVFARDPDAVIDYIELIITNEKRAEILNIKEREAFIALLDKEVSGWDKSIDTNELITGDDFLSFIQTNYKELGNQARKMRVGVIKKVGFISAWRMEGDIREFEPIGKKNFFFEHPVHIDDSDGLLTDAKAEGEDESWTKKKKKSGEDRKKAMAEQQKEIMDAFNELSKDKIAVTVGNIAQELTLSQSTIRNKIKQSNELDYSKGAVFRKGSNDGN